MTPEQFCCWLQGRAELDATPPTEEQWRSIREHLALVFTKVTRPITPVPTPLQDWPSVQPLSPLQINPKDFPPGTIIC